MLQKIVFNLNTDPTRINQQPLFFGEELSIARYDYQPHKIFNDLLEIQLAFYWRPHEVSLAKDKCDFEQMSNTEKHIFTTNLQYQTVLDSIQGRAPNLCFLPIVSSNALESFINLWTAFENLHSDSYTHIIRSLYANPSVVFDEIYAHQQIKQNAAPVTQYYDDLLELIYYYHSVGVGVYRNRQDKAINVGLTELRLALFKAMIATNALEALRFHVAFACHFALAENNKLEGCAKIMRFIARDEAVHCSATHNIINNWFSDQLHDPDMYQVVHANKDLIEEIYRDVIAQEKWWAKYIFAQGSLPGLNYNILCKYIDYLAFINLRLLNVTYPQQQNPIPWVEKYLSTDNVQYAPQEVEISSYLVGQTQGNIEDDDFKGIIT